MAKIASQDPPSILKIPYTDLFNIFKEQTHNATKDFILNEAKIKGKNYFNLFYKDSKKPWFYNKKIKRDMIVSINRCRADHYNLNSSLARISIVEDQGCDCGWEKQDINHVIWQCPKYNDQRTKMIDGLRNLKQYLPLDINQLLIKPDILALNHVYEFLKKCNIKL